MKKMYLVVLGLVLVGGMIAAPAEAAENAVPVPEAPAPAPATEEAVEPTQDEGEEQNFTPAWNQDLVTVYNCPGHPGCGYVYNKLTGCCVATTPIPGCSCGNICL